MGSSLLVDGLNMIPALDQVPILLAETSRLAQLANNFWLGLQVALGLGFVIFVHELGHFLAAKTFGVRCDKFYVGFDVPISIGPIRLPRTLGKFQFGETEYGIGIIPLGGYVKMLGQDDDPRRAEEEAAKIRTGEGEDAPLDPRSYPAKPVWQRMIIISAGVIMNLVFAVILAGVAYWFGVPYTPTVAGSTYGGGPAWAAGIESGDKVVRVGKMSEDNPELRYGDFAMSVVMNGFENQDAKLPVALLRGEQRLEIEVEPTEMYTPDRDFYRVGLSPPTTPTISEPAYREESFLASEKPDLQVGDVIQAVNGDPLPVDPRMDAVLGSELTRRLQAHWEQPVTLTIERPGEDKDASPEKVEVQLPPVPVNSLGLGFAVGPVTSVRKDSLGAEAGIQVGDVIETVDGTPVENALELPTMLGRLAGEVVQLGVRRASPGENESGSGLVELTLQNAQQPHFDPISDLAGRLTLGGVGVAFDVRPLIQSVDEAIVGSEGGIQPGDELLQVHWILEDAEKSAMSKYFSERNFKPLVIDDSFNVASLYGLLQSMPAGAEFSCIVRRDGQVSDPVTIKTQYADGWYWHQRGIMLSQLMQTYQTDNLATAAKLGFWETSRRFTEVLNFLKLLVTGRIGSKGLGGPGRIAYAAASEASFGVSRLLIFLTLLSANLAILNFLPIPALDGGHMMFLTAEAIRGKPVSEALQVRLTMMGVLGLLSLMAFVIVKDILWFI